MKSKYECYKKKKKKKSKYEDSTDQSQQKCKQMVTSFFSSTRK